MSWTKTRSQIALAKKQNPDADVLELQRQLKAERLEDYIATVLASTPPLTASQRARLRDVLGGGNDAT